MQENSIYNLKSTKKAGIVNFVSVALLALLILVFFSCLNTGVIGDGVDNSDGQNEGLGFAISVIVLLPFIIFGFSLWALFSLYKIVFGSILLKVCSKAQAGQEPTIARGLFVVSLILRILSMLGLLWTGFFTVLMIDAGGTPILAVVFGLIFVGLTIFEFISIFMEKKAQQEQIDVRQYQSPIEPY